MSVDYNLNIETSLTPQEVAGVAAQELASEVYKHNETFCFRVKGTYSYAQTTENRHPEIKKSWLKNNGLLPTVQITFEDYSGEGIEDARKAISHGAGAIFNNVEGKAVLLYNADDSILVRKLNGKIEITDSSEYDWLLRGFDDLGIKYERKPLSFLII